MSQYYIIYKPFGTISQFSPEGDKPTLTDLYKFPPDVYPVGRLDADSEGLLILTNDKSLNNRLLHPNHNHFRTYYVQVEGVATTLCMEQLTSGTLITLNGKPYRTLPATAEILSEAPTLPERFPSIRFRKTVPVSWLKITLKEGKNRQVRKMTASVGLPTLRLVRFSIEGVTAEGMVSGEVREITREKLFTDLFEYHQVH